MSMERTIYRMVIVSFFIVGSYDIFTSFVGAVSLFKLSRASPLYLWGLPLAISIGAFCLNLITRAVWDKDTGMRGLIPVWMVFLLYDFYTSFLGVAHIMYDGTVFPIKLAGIYSLLSLLAYEEILGAVVIALIVVASPMSAFVVMKMVSRSD